MKRKLAISLIALAGLWIVGTSVLRSQGVGAPPAPPAPPAYVAAPAPPAPPAVPAPPQGVIELGEGRAWLGVTLSDVTANRARELKLPGDYGAFVDSVEDNSPAAKAGLMKGDVILDFDGERVRSVAELRRLVHETPAGRTVNAQVFRAGQTRTLKVTPEARKDHFSWFQGPGPVHIPEIHIPSTGMENFNFVFRGGPTLGISGDDISGQLAQYFGVKQGKGVLVREVVAGSAAEKAGLKAGDVIVSVDGKEVDSTSELRRALPRDFEGTKKVTLTIVRDRREQTLTAELQAPENMFPVRTIERKVITLSPQERKHITDELMKQAAELRAQAAQAMREWTQNKQEYMQEVEHAKQVYTEAMRRYLDQMKKDIQENQKLKEYRNLLREHLFPDGWV
jgi:serine protease Do